MGPGLLIGNFVFVQIPDGPAATLHERLAQRNIYVRYFNLPGLEDKLRITVGTKQQNQTLVAAMRELLSK